MGIDDYNDCVVNVPPKVDAVEAKRRQKKSLMFTFIGANVYFFSSSPISHMCCTN